MKINIVKHCRTALIYCLCVTIAAGSNNLKIFRNVDNMVVEVSSKIEVPKGANLTLICQDVNIKYKGIANGGVTWFTPPEIHSELKLKALKNSSNLVFRNVNTNDEGLYVCANLKFKIFKTLYLFVKQSKSAKLSYLNYSRLTKREVIPGNRLDLNGTDSYSAHQSSTNSFPVSTVVIIFGLILAAFMIFLLILACIYEIQNGTALENSLHHCLIYLY